MDTRTKHYLKLSVAVVLVLGSLLFVYAQYKASTPPKPSIIQPRENDSASTTRPINEGEIQKIFPAEERKQMREEIYSKLELTPEQHEKMEKIAQKYEGKFTPDAMEARMKEWQEVLTPDQWQKGQNMRGEIVQKIGDRVHSRIMQRAQVLPEAERRKFEEKLDQRIQERQQRVEDRLNELNSSQQSESEKK